MSVWVTREVWKYSEAHDGARLTLLALADSADKDTGISRVKQATLVNLTRLSERAVRDSLGWLEDAVEIETRQAVKHRTRINIYRVVLGDYAGREVDESDLPFRMLSPFSTPAELAVKRLATTDDDRQILPVVAAGDDRQDLPGRPAESAAHKEGPFLDPVTEEAKNASSVPADAGERDSRRVEISLALTAALGIAAADLTRSARGSWEYAISDLVDVGATAEQIAARTIAYRQLWPTMALTAPALTKHWAMLGARVEIAIEGVSLERWLTSTMPQLEPEHARDIVDNWPGLTDQTRVDAVAAIDTQQRRAA